MTAALACVNAAEAQVSIEGGSLRAWETAMTVDDADLVVIDGSWPLPPRGQ